MLFLAPLLPLLALSVPALARPTNSTCGRESHRHKHNGTTTFNGTEFQGNSTAPVSASTVSVESFSSAVASASGSASASAAVVSDIDSASATPTAVEALAAASSSAVASSAVSSAAAAASSPVTSSTGSSDADTILALHNNFRAMYGAGAVTWSDDLASYAQTVSDTCVFAHSNGQYGENIAAGVGGGYNITSGFESWADEASLYDWNNPGYSDATGHFTQIVWKATTQIGCATTSCADGTIWSGMGSNSLFLVCEYEVPGNVVGNNNEYFTENVGTYQG